jgi:hypothetical protein
MAITVAYREGFGSEPRIEAQEFLEEGLGWEVDAAGYLTLERSDDNNPDYGTAVAVFAPGIWLFAREQED